MGARQIEEAVDGVIENRLGAGYPGGYRIFAFAIALGHDFAGAQGVVHPGKEMGIDQVVGIKDAKAVIAVVL